MILRIKESGPVEVNQWLYQHHYLLPYLGSPVYFSEYWLYENLFLKIYSYGQYVLIPSISTSLLFSKSPTKISSIGKLEILECSSEIWKIKIKVDRVSKIFTYKINLGE